MFEIAGTKRNRVLIIGAIVVFKLVLAGLFSSDYQDKMFIPFVKMFLGGGHDPYEYYYAHNLTNGFPYFPYMLFAESIGGALLNLVPDAGIFWRDLLFKIPLLSFDLLGFFALRRMSVRFKYAVAFYFCSPIVILGTYVYGQPDIIPTVLALLAVAFLLDWKNKRNLFFYAVFLGLAVGCKFHIAAAAPVLFFYVAKKRDYLTSLKYHGLAALVVLLPCAVFWSDGFLYTVLFNAERSALMTVGLDYGSVKLSLLGVAVLLVYLNVYELNYFNKSLLVSMLSLLFTVFLITLSPMPVWYIWAVPFYAIYFSFLNEDKYKTMKAYAVFNGLYLVYFIFLHQAEPTYIYFLGEKLAFLKVNNEPLKTCVFAVMTACLIFISLKIYRFGIASNNLYQRRGQSFVIGVAGDSGAGKSRLLEKIRHLFGTEKDILFIEGDGDHRWARGDENWEQYTALDPQANFLYWQAQNIRQLKNGNYVLRRDYDHDTGEFTEQKRLAAKKYIVLCGLHSLYLPVLRAELDLKIFMDTDPELRNYWKIQRDTKKRGYAKENVLAQIKKRLPDAQKYIYPQKEYADVIITYFDKTLTDCLADGHEVELSVRFELNVDYDLEYLIKSFEVYGVHPRHYICNDFYRQGIVFDGKELAGDIDFQKIAEINVPQYEDFFTYSPVWGRDVEGVIQVILLYVISEKMRDGHGN